MFFYRAEQYFHCLCLNTLLSHPPPPSCHTFIPPLPSCTNALPFHDTLSLQSCRKTVMYFRPLPHPFAPGHPAPPSRRRPTSSRPHSSIPSRSSFLPLKLCHRLPPLRISLPMISFLFIQAIVFVIEGSRPFICIICFSMKNQVKYRLIK